MADNNSINDYRPTCPVIFFERGNNTGDPAQIYTIHCSKLNVLVEAYVSTAIIRMEGTWTNRTKDTLDCVFALPTAGTVMNVKLVIGQDRVLTTAIVSKDEARDLMSTISKKGKHGGGGGGDDTATNIVPEQQSPYEQYTADLFRLPFGVVAPGDDIHLTCEYLEPLPFFKKGYIVSVPLYFPQGTIVENATWHNVVSVECRINALAANCKIDCWSHNVQETHDADSGAVVVRSAESKPLEAGDEKSNKFLDDADVSRTGRDFELSYSVKSEEIQAHCVQEVDVEDADSGSLCIFITPPVKLSTTFGRAFFFLLDRSGSMVGEPYREAIRALNRALDRLRPSDQFNVCAFDHEQVFFQDALVAADKATIQRCKQWIDEYPPNRGGTVMNVPIERALAHLESCELLPFVVLITDGAVANEREICKQLEENKDLRSRFITLGIGSYCNWFFLKTLAKIGRGFSDVVVYKEHIYYKIDRLLRMANTPVLTDIEVGLKSDEIELYPFPIPDLFIGAPVVIAARYTSTECPKKITIRGYDPHGEQYTIACQVDKRNDLPVEKIFIKQQIDLMTADAWLSQSKSLESEVAALSMHTNMPSMYTDVVMYETTQLLLDQEEKKLNDLINEQNDDDELNNNRHRRSKLMAKMKNNKKTVAALAVGGTFAVVAVGAMTFGDVQATMDNIPILGGGNDIDPDFECCGDCDDGCGDCDDCGDADCGDCSVM
eukprot:CAMPEP_0202688042 /NCGR_PEP_ID=MMETSP1385-20130828/3579_1 /ASSEMBLY_ACC=CAM_ASM_000861 /TAXON_ID=933848 /ORGANISM="Elphidium margaritaceum" /LENGTH=718 /DNA_ID=CAMNT_0049342919 /DNA_START=32 /DNA_END=2188 /DNA_ORIENTATION=-